MESSDDESDDDVHKEKRQSSKQQKKLDALTEEVSMIKEMLKDLVEVTKGIPVPVPILKLMKDAFKCNVCLTFPIVPPVIATTCCEAIIGCSKCINNWYAGEGGLDKSCPKCRGARDTPIPFS